MKTYSLISAAAAATLFLIPLARATVDTAPAPDSSASDSQRAARHAELIRRFDANGDGKLDETEKAAAKAAMKSEHGARSARHREMMLKRYDKNGDGKLDDSEKAAALADMEARPGFIRKFDTDGDGKLNVAEKAIAEAAVRQRWDRSEAAQKVANNNSVPNPNVTRPAQTQQ